MRGRRRRRHASVWVLTGARRRRCEARHCAHRPLRPFHAAPPAGASADDFDEHALLDGERWRFASACGALLALALSATENLRLDVSLSDALAPLDRQEVAQGAVTLAHQLGW